MKKRFEILILMLLPVISFAQVTKERDVVASAGNYSTSPSISLSWTLGEPAVQTVSVGTLIVTEGFQQADNNLVGIVDKSFVNEILVYPNPVSDLLSFEVRSEESMELRAELFDITGRKLMDVPVFRVQTEYKGEIDCNTLPSGKWFLRFIKTNGEVVKTFNITKI